MSIVFHEYSQFLFKPKISNRSKVQDFRQSITYVKSTHEEHEKQTEPNPLAPVNETTPESLTIRQFADVIYSAMAQTRSSWTVSTSRKFDGFATDMHIGLRAILLRQFDRGFIQTRKKTNRKSVRKERVSLTWI